MNRIIKEHLDQEGVHVLIASSALLNDAKRLNCHGCYGLYTHNLYVICKFMDTKIKLTLHFISVQYIYRYSKRLILIILINLTSFEIKYIYNAWLIKKWNISKRFLYTIHKDKTVTLNLQDHLLWSRLPFIFLVFYPCNLHYIFLKHWTLSSSTVFFVAYSYVLSTFCLKIVLGQIFIYDKLKTCYHISPSKHPWSQIYNHTS